MKLILCDADPEVIQAWRAQFARHTDVQIYERPLLEAPADGIVYPGNSFGFMDSGLGLMISEKFGFPLEDGIRAAIGGRYFGEMLVGQGEVFPTGGSPPYLVYSPSMRTPQSIQDTVNIYLSARGAFLAVKAFNQAQGREAVASVAFPAMGTGAGKMQPLVAARQLRYAFEEAMGLRKLADQNLSRLIRREKKLKEVPAGKEETE